LGGTKRTPDAFVRVVIAGGGTGGHLYPGIAVARELLSRYPDAVVSFAGTARGIEARYSAFGFDLKKRIILDGWTTLVITHRSAQVLRD